MRAKKEESLSSTEYKEQVRALYGQIPLTKSVIELRNYSGLEYAWNIPNMPIRALLTQHIAYIPKHITEVSLFGQYIDGLMNLSHKDDPEPYMVEVSKISSIFHDCVHYLPSSVHSLRFNCSYNPIHTNPVTVDELINTVKDLPKNIKKLHLSGTDLFKSDVKELIQLFASIPSSVTTVSVRLFSTDLIAAVVSSLPDTIEELILDNCCIRDWTDVFIAIKPGIKTLSVRGNKMGALSEEQFASFFSGLHHGLEALDLSHNELAQISGENLQKLFGSLPPALKILGFGSNIGTGGCVVDYERLITALSAAPDTIQEFDFSRNGFINFRGFHDVAARLPKNINSLAIFETLITQMNASVVSAQLEGLPRHVNTLSFKSHLGLFRAPIDQWVDLVTSTPKTVTTLDFSDMDLNQWSEEKLTTLFSVIPKHITQLILKNNHLTHINIHVLRNVFSALGPWIVGIDLSENGFDRLSGVQFKERMDTIPEQVRCTLDKNQFYTRTKGALIALPFFKRVASDKTKIQESSETNLIALSTFSQMTQARLDVVRYRITSLIFGANQIDLSRCELNLLDSFGLFASLLRTIPETIISINMSDNRFQDIKEVIGFVALLLKQIPKGIVHVDLSGHGFEFFSAESLRALFIYIPRTNIQYVSLLPGKPISPAHQIAKREWPVSYTTLTHKTPHVMHQARQVLDDYTKRNSAFLRFLFGHWSRTHVKEVSKMVKFIDEGIITSLNELLDELEAIEMPNEVGSLNKRVSFLYHLMNKQVTEHSEASNPESQPATIESRTFR